MKKLKINLKLWEKKLSIKILYDLVLQYFFLLFSKNILKLY